jgi:hypothetical protein
MDFAMTRPLLFVSLVCNAALVAALALRSHRAAGAARVESNAESLERSGLAAGGAKPGAAVHSETSAIEIFQWAQLDQSSWQAYRDSLLVIGCPARTVQEILLPLIDREYVQNALPLTQPVRDRFWEYLCPPAEQRLMGIIGRLEEISRKRQELIEALFAGFPAIGDQEAGIDPADPRFDFLPPGKRELVVDAYEKLSREQQEWNAGFQGDQNLRQARLKEFEAQTENELAAVLTPDELKELKLRRSSGANVRLLENSPLTPDEEKAVAELRERLAANGTAGNAQKGREELEQLLGAEKAAALLRAEDPEFEQVSRLTDRLELPAERAAELWKLQSEAAEAATKLRASWGADTTPDQRRGAILAMRQALEVSVGDLLGSETGAAVWKQTEESWLNRWLTPPAIDPLAKPPEP